MKTPAAEKQIPIPLSFTITRQVCVRAFLYAHTLKQRENGRHWNDKIYEATGPAAVMPKISKRRSAPAPLSPTSSLYLSVLLPFVNLSQGISTVSALIYSFISFILWLCWCIMYRSGSPHWTSAMVSWSQRVVDLVDSNTDSTSPIKHPLHCTVSQKLQCMCCSAMQYKCKGEGPAERTQ